MREHFSSSGCLGGSKGMFGSYVVYTKLDNLENMYIHFNINSLYTEFILHRMISVNTAGYAGT